jgi:hypothetical protein
LLASSVNAQFFTSFLRLPNGIAGRIDAEHLYWPTEPEELVRESGFRSWLSRLEGQPIVYPVTNEQYAAEIASRWNVKDKGAGFVTRLQVRKSFMDRYEVQRVGAEHHTEWWIPASHLKELNDNIVGEIEVIPEYHEIGTD